MTDVLIRLLVVLPMVDWFAAIVLGYLTRRHPTVLTLRERAVASVILAVVASGAGFLAWARIGLLNLSSDDALLILAVILTLVSFPSVLWLALLASGRFRIPKDQR